VEAGWEVVVLDNLSTGKRENLEGLENRLDLIVGDITDLETVQQCCQGADLAFHHAALASVPQTVEDPVQSALVNDMGTLNVFLAARDAGLKRVVYASSSAVYGDGYEPPHDESMTPQPDTPYAAHKLLGEHYARMFGALYNLEVVSLRYFNVYGPRQDPFSPYSGVISIFMDRLYRNQDLTVYGDGGQSRDFVYVDDVVRANFLAAQAPDMGGKVMNIGTGKRVTLNEMIGILENMVGQKIGVEYASRRAGDVYASGARVDRALELLNYQSEVPFEEGLGRTWDWYRNRADMA
jgi:nucleoside-diphosphate-sugar epimerase